MTKIKRKLMFSVLFDIETVENASDSASVSVYYEIDNDTIDVRVKSGFIDLPLYKEKPKAVNTLKKLKGLKEIYSFCKYALNEVIPNYQGDRVINDHYISPSFDYYMQATFGIINIKNDPIPEEY